MKYRFTIIETAEYETVVEADSYDRAREIALESYGDNMTAVIDRWISDVETAE